MLKIVEAFSGIGSQAKALTNIGVDYQVVNTIEWDINAIIAYDIIHNGKQTFDKFEKYTDSELRDLLSVHTLSANGKEPMKQVTFNNLKRDVLLRLVSAIERTNNLVSIKEVTFDMLPDDIDIFTYSFPCQDLSISGFWHGNKGGIDRDANNRSSMLWEVERILLEFRANNKPLPKFLLMENVTSIRSPRHVDNFNEWKSILKTLGYSNIVYDLSAENFGVPQRRKRTFMLSVLTSKDVEKEKIVENYWGKNNLEQKKLDLNDIEKYLRLDYSNRQIFKEVELSIPNRTESRVRIKAENPVIVKKGNIINHNTVRTITTKQDRHPNSGVIEHDLDIKDKCDFRYLTPRECFLLMGFEEKDYESLIENNFYIRKNGKFFTRDKLIKMAGNSIVVDVIEQVFKQIEEINELLFD